jgi:rubrerythrin
MTGDRGNIERRPDDDEIIPLADPTLVCTGCGSLFEPVSGETLCPRCVHVARPEVAVERGMNDAEATCRSCGHSLRGLPIGTPCPECGHGGSREARPTVAMATVGGSIGREERGRPPARLHRRPEVVVDDLSTRGLASSVAVGGAVTTALACAGAVAILALSHWWIPSLLGDWSIVIVWALFAVIAAVLHAPGTLPPGRLPRWWGRMAIGGAVVAAAALVAYALTRGIGGVPLQALWDILVVCGAIAYLIALSVRVNAMTEYAGQDPSERGFLSSSAPFLGAVFIVACGFLLTAFFRRSLDFADAFALAVAFWMGWRLTALLWHTKNAVRAGREATERAERRQLRRSESSGDAARDAADAATVDAACAACGHALRGLPRHARCPECGSQRRI